MLENKKIVELLKRKISGQATPRDLKDIAAWAAEDPARKKLLLKIENEYILFKDVVLWLDLQNSKNKVKEKVWSKIERPTVMFPLQGINWKAFHIASAAIIFLAFIGSIFNPLTIQPFTQELVDIDPGSTKAILRIVGQDEINLDERHNEIVVGQNLTYNDGTIVSSLEDVHASAELITPKGGTYCIELSDGTKVRLNADSKLTYPLKFGGDVREVSLVGEAYFEVNRQGNPQKYIPLIVNTPNQKVQVLGTSFNISAYPDEEDENTTLVSGEVEIKANNSSIKLIKGEQSSILNGKLEKKTVNINSSIGWINGEFVFYETPIDLAIKELSRWYDFEVESQQKLPITHLYGSISRNKKLSEVLEILNNTGLNFKIKKEHEKHFLIIK